VFVPSIVIGELYYGAENSTQVAENIARVDQFESAMTILDCDGSVAREYGRLKHQLKRMGTPIPENDIWIAAMALRHGLTLASRDAHFSGIPALNVGACA
jgi:tRNA(fMet)-specific endonuclease VapC